MPGNDTQPRAARGRTLVAIIGAVAATGLLTQVPMEESGRKVDVTVDASTGAATVRHVAGRQYLRSYLDAVGVPTACDGIIRGVRMGQSYTEEQCAAKLEEELIIHADGVMRCTPGLRGDGRDYQRWAAVSLAYNVGVAGWCGSTARRLFDAGRYREGCDAFLRWNRAGGRVLRGLTVRRQRERAVCLRGL